MQDKRRKLSLSHHYQGNIHFNSTNIDRTEGVIFLERHDLPSTKESIRVAGVGWLSCTTAESLRAFVESVFANFRDKRLWENRQFEVVKRLTHTHARKALPKLSECRLSESSMKALQKLFESRLYESSTKALQKRARRKQVDFC